MSQENYKFGWLKDLIPNHEKFSQRYGFALTANYNAEINSKRRHSLYELFNYTPDVYEQGNLSSCTANAILCAFKIRLQAQSCHPQNLSRLFLYYEERVRLNCINEDGGATLYSGIDVLQKNGVCLEFLHQYVPSKFREKPSEQCYQNAKRYLLLDTAPVQQNLKEIKNQLLNGCPVVFGFMVYSSFMSPDVKKTGNVPTPRAGERFLGGHASMIYGFDDDKNGGSFLCRNSWGIGWGDHGNFYIKYEYLLNNNLAEDFWSLKRVENVDPF